MRVNDPDGWRADLITDALSGLSDETDAAAPVFLGIAFDVGEFGPLEPGCFAAPVEGGTDQPLAWVFEQIEFLVTAEVDTLSSAEADVTEFDVVFLTDGFISTDADMGSTEAIALSIASDFNQLAPEFGVASTRVNTVFVSSEQHQAESIIPMLEQLAAQGGGSFRNAAAGESINFL